MASEMTIQEMIEEATAYGCNISIVAVGHGRVGGPSIEMRLVRDDYTVSRHIQASEITTSNVGIMAWNFEAMIVMIETEFQRRDRQTQEINEN